MGAEIVIGMGMLIGLLIGGSVSLILFIYVIYDLVRNQDTMQGVEKAVWLLIILLFQPLLGPIVYIIVTKIADTTFLEEAAVDREKTRINELERLTKLHENNALTDEEFKKEKKRILTDYNEIENTQ